MLRSQLRRFAPLAMAPLIMAGSVVAQNPDPAQMAALTETIQKLHAELKAANPNYNGSGQFKVDSGKVLAAGLSGTGVTDISALAGLDLKELDLKGLQVTDISALKDMELVALYLEEMPLADISPLVGAAKTMMVLYLSNTKVTDLSALKGSSLRQLNLLGAPVSDISPLAGVPLEMLWLNETQVADISPLAKCPIKSLTLHKTPVADLSALAGSTTLERLHIGETEVTDLTPLKDLKLTRLIFDPSKVTKGLDDIRKMTSLTELGTTFETRGNPEDFWKSVEGKR